MSTPKDIYGAALLDFYNNEYTEDITVLSPTIEDDILPLPYLFRTFAEMPTIEQQALLLCKGHTLDIGCGAGSHALWLTDNNQEVSIIDQSAGAITVSRKRIHTLSRKRMLKNNITDSIWNHTSQYDTLLLLMNGTGIFEQLSNVDNALQHLKAMLKPGGQILVDSSDLAFLFRDEEDGGIWQDASTDYYGEVTFSMQYKGETTPDFNWLYLDFELLKKYAQKNELCAELIVEGDHYDYLARLTIA